ncbi:bifunctional DNA primase/polymerase [Kutzneria chonburiensis]|uniref:Bifunctional DNA primase/polymerase n=1 Tax=Kutzneria chonburiensis TaxID=1483604 RepID=A0ABV6N3J4_9PSEU
MTSTRDMLAAALAAAALGLYVFPIRQGRKKPPAFHGVKSCPRKGICRNGHQGWEQRAMVDPDLIRWYWTSREGAGCNVGIACGPSGIVLVDLDTPKSPEDVPSDGWNRRGIRDGHDVFTAVCEQAGQPVPWETRAVATPRGGTHLYFREPPGVQLRSTEGEQGNGLGWKVDTRAHGGYVVAPGSVTDDGRYTITEDCAPAELPAWLASRLASRPPAATTAAPVRGSERLPAYVAAAVRGECDRVAAAQPGRHTRTLFSAAGNLGQFVGGNLLPPVEAEAALYAAARHMITGDCDCTERELRRTITNGLRAGAFRPRVPPTDPPATTQGGLFGQRGAA